MAYTGNNPRLLADAISGPRIWMYVSGDALATVNNSGYISDGGTYGMKVNDFVLVFDTGNNIISGHTVVTVNATTKAVDLSDGTTLATSASNAD